HIIFPFSIISSLGREMAFEVYPYNFKENDIFTIISTSGTSGKSKAIKVKARCVNHLVSETVELFKIDENDTFMGFLPLYIYLERIYVYAAIFYKFKIILTSINFVSHVLKKEQISITVGVPIFFESIQKLFLQRIKKHIVGNIYFLIYLSFRK